jgi:methylenetetrahydrofolate dehydrogenase (NADP+) / methenyltetrahydrofolate cyclohydrolase
VAQIIEGQQVAQRIRAQVAQQAADFKAKYGFAPGLGVVMAGDNPASQMYVRMKQRASAEAGIDSFTTLVDANTPHAEVEAAVKAYNDDPRVHGILVQLPLPSQVDEEKVLAQVSLDKDVDGFHPINIGALAMKGREPTFTPATPTGCMILIQETGVSINGANAVVLGRSNIVGLPMAMMLLKANATVTICHSRTRDLPGIIRQADILVAAIGQADFVKGDWIKPGAVVIDVGTNQIPDASQPRGYKYVGDVEYASANEVAGYITRVPGGVGPMTIAMLLQNTVKAARRIAGETV